MTYTRPWNLNQISNAGSAENKHKEKDITCGSLNSLEQNVPLFIRRNIHEY